MPVNFYLDRYSFRNELIESQPDPNLGIVVTIPAYREESLVKSLSSLRNCDTPGCSVEVIVVFNQPEGCDFQTSETNRKAFVEASTWAAKFNRTGLHFHILKLDDLPVKHFGVGLARKIAMDEAVRRFERINNHRGVITGFDADCECDRNYLTAIESHFKKNVNTEGCSIYYEHPLSGQLDPTIYEGIIYYELHLRYLVNAFRWSGFPHAFHTIGSSMAVRSQVYQKQGGMNRRNAGEDFHFLHKIIPLGNFTELNTTIIFPSPRESERVPFGTGKAMKEWSQDPKDPTTYNPAIFKKLKQFLKISPKFFKENSQGAQARIDELDRASREFLANNKFLEQLGEMNRQSPNTKRFRTRFFNWFNGLRALKYVHYLRDHSFPNCATGKSVAWLLEQYQIKVSSDQSDIMLEEIRKLDRAGRTLKRLL